MKKAQKIMQDKFKEFANSDYYEELANQEKRSHELANKIDRETSSEDRILNMIKRTLKLREGE